MKLTYKISRMAQVLIASCCLVSCNYLDVIPPAQADFKDTMKDEEATLANMHARMASQFISDLYLKANVKDQRYLFF